MVMRMVEKIKKIYWGRIISISVVCTIVDMVFHGVGQKLGLVPDFQMPKSFLFNNPKLFVPALFITFLLTFGTLALMFNLIQEKLPGSRMAKGFRFGIAFWLLWVFGIFEWHFIYKSSWAYDLFNTAFVDGGFLFVVSVLAGRFIGTNSKGTAPMAKRGITAIVLITLFYLVGRYFNYSFFQLLSVYKPQPMETFLCLLGVGIWVGIMYLLLRSGLEGYSPLKRALWFGVLLFGTNWFYFVVFEPLLVEISMSDPVLRLVVDVVAVSAGVFVFEKFVHNKNCCRNDSG